MLTSVTCKKCGDDFAVERVYAKPKGTVALVRLEFSCPYCSEKYPVGSQLDLTGAVGGVNISGAGSLRIGGDIVGGDSIKFG